MASYVNCTPSTQLAIDPSSYPTSPSLSLSAPVCLVCVCVCFFIAVSTRPLAMLTDNMLRLRQPLREMVRRKKTRQYSQLARHTPDRPTAVIVADTKVV